MVVDLITNSSVIGAFAIGLGLSTGGTITAGLLLFIFGLLCLAIGMQIPFDIIFAVIYPLVVVAVMITTGFTMAILGMILIYFAIIISRGFFLN